MTVASEVSPTVVEPKSKEKTSSRTAMELLGLLDALESVILDGTKLPFTKRIVIDEEKVLGIVDKVRLVVQTGGELARSAVDVERREPIVLEHPREMEISHEDVVKDSRARAVTDPALQVSEILEQAYELSREIRAGADRYADEVLANLEATSARILRSIRAGRDRLKKDT